MFINGQWVIEIRILLGYERAQAGLGIGSVPGGCDSAPGCKVENRKCAWWDMLSCPQFLNGAGTRWNAVAPLFSKTSAFPHF